METSDVRWEYEDELPAMERPDFDAIFKASRVDVVRMYPFVEDSKGNRIWITYMNEPKTIERAEDTGCRGAAHGSATGEPRVQTLLRSMLAALDRDDADTYWVTFGMLLGLHEDIMIMMKSPNA